MTLLSQLVLNYFSPSGLHPKLYTGSRGNDILIFDGCRFRQNGRKGTLKTRWRCTTHAKYRCKANVQMVRDTVVQYHNHHTTSQEDEGADFLDKFYQVF